MRVTDIDRLYADRLTGAKALSEYDINEVTPFGRSPDEAGGILLSEAHALLGFISAAFDTSDAMQNAVLHVDKATRDRAGFEDECPLHSRCNHLKARALDGVASLIAVSRFMYEAALDEQRKQIHALRHAPPMAAAA